MLYRILVRVWLLPYQLFSQLFLSNKKLLIVTAADSRFYVSMIQMINSVKIHETGTVKIIAYDLGLTETQRFYFGRDYPDVQLKKFDFQNYPAHFNITENAGAYAWKPQIILNEYQSGNEFDYLLWVDAGCVIRRSLLVIRAALKFYGFYAICAGPSNTALTHPNTITLLDVEKEKNLRMLAATFIGFKKNTEKNSSLITLWVQAAWDPNIICPAGSSRTDHRYDQSIISLLFYKIYKTVKQPLISRKGLEILTHKNIWH